MIYEIEQIAARLDELFAPLESDGVTGLRLVRHDNVSYVAGRVECAQDRLSEQPPRDLMDLSASLT